MARVIIYPLLATAVVMALCYRDIKDYSATAEARSPNPVKVIFETDWHTYSWYQIPDWNPKTGTKINN